MATGTARVGCSGWSYTGWRGIVYDEKLRQSGWFAFYSGLFSTVEVNSTFYRLPPPATFGAWRAQAPEGFVYSVKLNRYGSHLRRLREPGTWLPGYLAGALLLGPALGPQLVQLPPRWRCDLGRLAEFCTAARKAETDLGSPPLRWALEVRDSSWLNDAVFNLLAEHGFALCVHDLLARHPWERTAGWSYLRFHGRDALTAKYSGEYGPQRLKTVAKRLSAWRDEGADVYAYFNNDIGGAAVRDATWLSRRLMS